MSAPQADHRCRFRIYYEDTDAAGIVYHANYLRFAERARTEFLREQGHAHPRLLAERGVLFTVRRCVADYRAPARLDELLTVETRVRAARGARLELDQSMRVGERRVAELRVSLALVDLRMRPVRLDRVFPEGLPFRPPDDTGREA